MNFAHGLSIVQLFLRVVCFKLKGGRRFISMGFATCIMEMLKGKTIIAASNLTHSVALR